MLNQSEKAYCQALLALRNKDYRAAVEFFDRAAPYFTENKEFNLLRETNRLLVAVKERLATAEHEGRAEPMLWTRPYGTGRVAYLALGHDAEAFGHPAFLELVQRSIRWAAGQV